MAGLIWTGLICWSASAACVPKHKIYTSDYRTAGARLACLRSSFAELLSLPPSRSKPFACPNVMRYPRFPVDELQCRCGRQRRANSGIWRFRWNGSKKLRLRSRLYRLLKIVRKCDQFWFLQESAVHPEAGRFAFRREADSHREVRITCHRRQRSI